MINFDFLFLITLMTFLIIGTIFVLVLFLNWFINDCSHYLNSLGKATTSQIRSEMSANQRYNLIKTLQLMKKYFGWSIVLITLSLITLSTIIIFDSRDYFKEVFENQRKELNLRSEASVDSLQTIIVEQNHKLDSLSIVNNSIVDNFKLLESKNKETGSTIKNLQNVIEHQNSMVNSLRTTIKNLEKRLENSN